MADGYSVCYTPVGYPRNIEAFMLIQVDKVTPPDEVVDNLAAHGAAVKWMISLDVPEIGHA